MFILVNSTAIDGSKVLATYFRFNVYDAMIDWASGDRRNTISLDNIARALGVGKKNGSGADFAATYATDKPKAIAYLKNDIALTRGVCQKMMAVTL